MFKIPVRFYRVALAYRLTCALKLIFRLSTKLYILIGFYYVLREMFYYIFWDALILLVYKVYEMFVSKNEEFRLLLILCYNVCFVKNMNSFS